MTKFFTNYNEHFFSSHDELSWSLKPVQALFQDKQLGKELFPSVCEGCLQREWNSWDGNKTEDEDVRFARDCYFSTF